MVRVVGLESTPNILGDSTEALDRPRRRREEGSFDVAQVPPDLQIELERRRASTPQTPPVAAPPPQATVRTTRSEADIIREQAELKQKQEELQRSQGAAKRQQQAAIAARFEPALNAPAPQFEAPKESFAQFGALAAMMMVMGAMGGGKGLTSATGAMNAMAGMMKGYQEGRKEAYNNAKMQFEQNYKAWQANKAQIKEAFARALKFAPQDIQGATDKAVAELNAAGATTLAASVKTQGLQSTANTFASASDKADKEIETIGASIARMTGQTAQRPETGVQLAGDPQRGIPLTLEEIKRRQRDLETEQKVRAAEQKETEAQRRAAPRESADPQFIVVPGMNQDRPFRATRKERDTIAGAGFDIQYVRSGEPKEPEQPSDDRIKPTTSIGTRYDANVDSIDDMLLIVSNSKNEKLRKEWAEKRLNRLFIEPLSDTFLAKGFSIIQAEKLSPEAKELAEAIMRARNSYYKAISGSAVTGSEAMRNFGAEIQPQDSFDVVMRKAGLRLKKFLDKQDEMLEGYAFPKTYERKAKERRDQALKYTDAPRASLADIQATAEKNFGGDIERTKKELRARGFILEGE